MPATTTTADEKAFLARIAANPADDTDRLVYADWLDEHAGTIPCANCHGSGWEPGRGGYEHCGECMGSEPQSDGRRERAEFIRVQCAIARHPQTTPTCPHCGCDDGYNHNTGCLYSREDELRTAHETEWRPAGVCPICDGKGYHIGVDAAGQCSHCWGSGDVGGLLRKSPVTPEGYGPGGVEREALRVDFERGFPYRVHCRLEDVARLECPDCGGLGRHGYAECSGEQMWRPTPWALAVVRHHPVTQFRVDVPFNSTDNANAWHKSTIPDFLFDLIQGHDSSAPDAAHTAMAAVLAAWARAFPAGS